MPNKHKKIIGLLSLGFILFPASGVTAATTPTSHYASYSLLLKKYATAKKTDCSAPLFSIVKTPTYSVNFMCNDGTLGYWFKTNKDMAPYLRKAQIQLSVNQGILFGDNWYMYSRDRYTKDPLVLKALGGKSYYNTGK